MTFPTKLNPSSARFLCTCVVSLLLASAAVGGATRARAAGNDQFTAGPGDGGTSDLGEYLLGRCHVTGLFESASVVERPWSDAEAKGYGPSVVIDVRWRGGFTEKPYTTRFVMVHAKAPATGMSTWAIKDDSPIGALPSCSLMLGPK